MCMHINKYILWLAILSVIGWLWWLSVEALSISNSSFDKGSPVFKSIFLRSEGKDTINGATNPEKIRLDNNGLYISPWALPGALSNVLKLRADGYIQIDPVKNGDFVDNAITSNHIKNYSITNSNFNDLTIEARHLANSTIVKAKFNPAITFPNGVVYLTNNVCAYGMAITSVNGWTGSCAPLASWSTTLPSCSQWEYPVYSGGAWTCEILLIWGTNNWDPYRTWSTGGWIANSNAWNVWIGTSSPSRKLTVQWTTKFLGDTEEQVYCYANDTWVSLSSYNVSFCAWCNAWFHYNATTQLCEQNSCSWTWTIIENWACWTSNWQTFAVAPNTNLCNVGTASTVSGSGPWSWTCYGTWWGTNASCVANSSSNTTCWWYAWPIYVKRTLVNNQYSSSNSDPLCWWRPNWQHADEWDCQYDFYSDAAGTIPVNVTNLIINTDTSINCNYWGCIWWWAWSFVANWTTQTQIQCKRDYIEDFPPGWCGASYAGETIMTNSSCAQEIY